MTRATHMAELEDDVAELEEMAALQVGFTSYALGEAQVAHRNALVHHMGCSAWLTETLQIYDTMQRVTTSQSKRLRRQYAKAIQEIRKSGGADAEERIRAKKEAYAAKHSDLSAHKRLSWHDAHTASVAMTMATSVLNITAYSLEVCEVAYNTSIQGQHIAAHLRRVAESKDTDLDADD